MVHEGTDHAGRAKSAAPQRSREVLKHDSPGVEQMEIIPGTTGHPGDETKLSWCCYYRHRTGGRAALRAKQRSQYLPANPLESPLCGLHEQAGVCRGRARILNPPTTEPITTMASPIVFVTPSREKERKIATSSSPQSAFDQRSLRVSTRELFYCTGLWGGHFQTSGELTADRN